MQLNRARVIVNEITEWVNYHFHKTAKSSKNLDYTLFELIKAAETVKLNNIVLANSKKDHKIVAVPKDEMIAGAYLAHALTGMEENSRLEIASNGKNKVVIYGPDSAGIIISPNQLSIEDAIADATAKEGKTLVIVRG